MEDTCRDCGLIRIHRGVLVWAWARKNSRPLALLYGSKVDYTLTSGIYLRAHRSTAKWYVFLAADSLFCWDHEQVRRLQDCDGEELDDSRHLVENQATIGMGRWARLPPPWKRCFNGMPGPLHTYYSRPLVLDICYQHIFWYL